MTCTVSTGESSAEAVPLTQTPVTTPENDTDVGEDYDEYSCVPYAIRLARLLTHAARNDGISVGPPVCVRCRFWHADARQCPAGKAHYFIVYATSQQNDRDAVATSGADYTLVGSHEAGSLSVLLYFRRAISATAVERFFSPSLVLVTKLFTQDSVDFALNELLEAPLATVAECGIRPPLVVVSRSMSDRQLPSLLSHPDYNYVH